MIDRFREELYQSFTRRPDAALDFIDALASEGHTESPVAVSESSALVIVSARINRIA